MSSKKVSYEEFKKLRQNLKEIKSKIDRKEIDKFYNKKKRERILNEREEKGIVVKNGRPLENKTLSPSQKKKRTHQYYLTHKEKVQAKRKAQGWKPKSRKKLTEEEKKQRRKEYYQKKKQELLKYREENNIVLKKRGRKPKNKKDSD